MTASTVNRRRGSANPSLRINTVAFLAPRHRPDVRNVPAHASKRFHGGDNPHNQKRYVNERLDDSPKKHQNSTNRRNRPKDQEQDFRNDVKQQPRAPEDDRLHRVEAHKAVVLFDNVKNDPAN